MQKFKDLHKKFPKEIHKYKRKLKKISLMELSTYLKVNDPELFKVLHKESTCKTLKIRPVELFVFLYGDTGKCKSCGKETKWGSGSQSFSTYCGRKCSNSCPDKRKEIEATNLKNLGVKNPSQCTEILNKRKQHWLKKYGVDNPAKSKQVRDKFKQTCLDRFGVEHNFMLPQSNITKAKIQDTLQRRYGISHPLEANSPAREKAKETWKQKYGVDNPFKDKDIYAKGKSSRIKTNLRKYGVDNPMKVPEIYQRVKDTCKERYGTENAGHLAVNKTFKFKEWIDCLGTTHLVQGYEPKILDYLESHSKVEIIDFNVPEIKYSLKGKDRNYYPDILITSTIGTHHLIEVKSTYTLSIDFYKNYKKFKSATKYMKSIGGVFWLAVYSKGKIHHLKNPKSKRALHRFLDSIGD